MKRIIVTGGAGFLGSHLCKRLLDQGNEVICIDDLSTSWGPNLDTIQSDRFTFIQADVATLDLEWSDDNGIDEIYNLACPASPPRYQLDPIKTLRTCIHGAERVLELAERFGCRVLQASTSEVYGDPEVHPQPETYRGSVNPIGPRACYDEGKRAAETLFADYHRVHGTKIQIARIFNTYGPGLHPKDGRVVSNFVRQAITGDQLTVFGKGSQTRSFCYVDDLIDGLIRLMEVPASFVGPVNLGNPGEFTVYDLAMMILDITGKTSKDTGFVTRRIEYAPLPEDDPIQRRPVIDKARDHLGWTPTTSLRDGLTAMIAAVRDTNWVNW